MAIKLKGITWNHSRGYVSVVATAQRFMETHPGVEVVWEKRSLQEFADAPVNVLAEKYDLLVIDHPWAGFAASQNILVPFDKYLPEEYLADQAANSVGKSHASYNFDGYQTALAIDAATPVASYREDLMETAGVSVPDTWEQLLELAKRGWVTFPGIPIDTLMNFYMLCSTQGEDPFQREESVVSKETGLKALEQLRELAGYCRSEMFDRNPIQTYEAMARRDDIAYCPFAYGYSNYSRPGYSANVIKFTDMVSIGDHGRMRSTLGGTGLAISAHCRQLDIALEYAMYTADQECQRTVYFDNGGQPGHRRAWIDEEVNRRSSDYFRSTLPALDRAYLRPRYSGYLDFQDHAGDFVRDYLMNGGDAGQVLEKMNALYIQSRKGDQA